MFRRREDLSSSARALLDHERFVTPVPAITRTRAFGRARAALAEGPVARPLPSRGPLSVRWTAAPGLVCIASAAAGAAGYEIRIHAHPTTPTVVAPPPVVRPIRVAQPRAEPSRASRHDAPVRSLSRLAEAREELRLLQRARAAVAREDYAAAMPPLAEHARRFRDGGPAQAREALRVRALAGLGGTSEARRAGRAFEGRFPRSPLLPAVSQIFFGYAPMAALYDLKSPASLRLGFLYP